MSRPLVQASPPLLRAGLPPHLRGSPSGRLSPRPGDQARRPALQTLPEWGHLLGQRREGSDGRARGSRAPATRRPAKAPKPQRLPTLGPRSVYTGTAPPASHQDPAVLHFPHKNGPVTHGAPGAQRPLAAVIGPQPQRRLPLPLFAADVRLFLRENPGRTRGPAPRPRVSRPRPRPPPLTCSPRCQPGATQAPSTATGPFGDSLGCGRTVHSAAREDATQALPATL